MYENNLCEGSRSGILEKLNEKLKKWITPKSLAYFLTIAYIVSLIPLLWIGWYNYPSADDYTIGNNCRQAWLSTHNLFAVVWAGIVRAAEDWLNCNSPQQFWGEILCADSLDHDWDAEFINSLFAAEHFY